MTSAPDRPAGPSGVPAARQTLALLQALGRLPGPVPAAVLARDLGLPRSTTYHLLAEMQSAGFVVHLPEERRYGLGPAAFEIGTAYLRQEPLARLARPVLTRLVARVAESAHLAVLHGREVFYVVEARAPHRPTLVTDVGVRLPAALTASGRAVLSHLPAAHVRALFPDADAFVQRHVEGPTSLSGLRRILTEVRQVGHATEEELITPGFCSVAAAVFDHGARPIAAVAVTVTVQHWQTPARPELVGRVARAAAELTRRVGGRPPGPAVGA